MVLAQGLGDEDRQAPRDEEGDRGAGASVGRDPCIASGWIESAGNCSLASMMAARKLGFRAPLLSRGSLGGPNHSAGRPFSYRCRSNAANFRVIAERNEFGLTQSSLPRSASAER